MFLINEDTKKASRLTSKVSVAAFEFPDSVHVPLGLFQKYPFTQAAQGIFKQINQKTTVLTWAKWDDTSRFWRCWMNIREKKAFIQSPCQEFRSVMTCWYDQRSRLVSGGDLISDPQDMVFELELWRSKQKQKNRRWPLTQGRLNQLIWEVQMFSM